MEVADDRNANALLVEFVDDRRHGGSRLFVVDGNANQFRAGTGERSEKIRTYNFPQNRATDHRINLDRSLEGVLGGNLQPFTDALTAEERRRRLAE